MENANNDLDLWDAAAERYQEAIEGSDWRQNLGIRPAVMDCLGSVAGEDVLDAGCGPGLLAVELARRGARVTAFDGSEKMLALARERVSAGSLQVAVTQANLCRDLPFRSEAFDAVVCNMVLMDIPEIHTTLVEFRRMLRAPGRLVLSITHPCFYMWLWSRDGAGNKLYKPVDDYLTIRPDMNDFWGPTRHYHRPLSYYMSELSSAGFVVDAFLEPVPTFDRKPEEEHHWRIPDFVVIRALPR